MENYIVIGGKKAELTEEQLKALGIEPKRKNPFDRVGLGERFFIISSFNGVSDYKDTDSEEDNIFHENANYFNDEDFANQVLLHELLNRKLLKYAYDNEAEDCEWDGYREHYYIWINMRIKGYGTGIDVERKDQKIYFSKREVAEQAFKDVVKPFIEKHPEFVW